LLLLFTLAACFYCVLWLFIFVCSFFLSISFISTSFDFLLILVVGQWHWIITWYVTSIEYFLDLLLFMDASLVLTTCFCYSLLILHLFSLILPSFAQASTLSSKFLKFFSRLSFIKVYFYFISFVFFFFWVLCLFGMYK
jgi:hypothetical protein